jgi:hypothetical protein
VRKKENGSFFEFFSGKKFKIVAFFSLPFLSRRFTLTSASHSSLLQHHHQQFQKNNSYARVAARIEIELELESEVPVAEAAGISSEVSRLAALREAESAAAAGAAAADEVERLLRSP